MLFNPCGKINRKLSAYIDGELAPKDQAAVKEHLSACPACAEELRRFLDLNAGIKQLPGVTPTPFFAAKVSAAARALNEYHVPFRRFLRVPIPVMAVMVSFILINLFTFAFNINAVENGPRRELARKIAAQLVKPASIINPVALARLCGECSRYMCLCMHEAGKKSLCPCKDCQMEKMQAQEEPGETGDLENTENNHVH
ncbi:MAG: zf-HC2 domain-containing protein [Elusimicrobia bacterium]|nr:zf-HC2 domain-containing protein [Elusimicrobiota bacterium]